MRARTLRFLFVLCVISAYGALNGQAVEQVVVENITPQEVKAKLDSAEQVILIDVRTKGEFNGSLGHIEGAHLFPLHHLEEYFEDIKSLGEGERIVYCRGGVRSVTAVEKLIEHGIAAKNMTGGMLEWNKLGYPVVRVVEEEEE